MSRMELWKARLEEQKNSGLKKRAWCELHGVNYNTMQYWSSVINKSSSSNGEIIFRELPSLQASSLKLTWENITFEM